LPYVTEGTGFRGRVLATEPTVMFGQLLMTSLTQPHDPRVIYPERVPNPNSPSPNPLARELYSRKQMLASLDRIEKVTLGEVIQMTPNLRVRVASSGLYIGSCFWVFETQDRKILAHINGASSLRRTCPRHFQFDPLKDTKHIVMDSLSNCKIATAQSFKAICNAMGKTLRSRGSVLFPSNLTGAVYDLIEQICVYLNKEHKDQNIPIYLISKIGHHTLEYSTIFGEWLSKDHMKVVEEARYPFVFQSYIKKKRIIQYNSVNQEMDLVSILKREVIIFSDHPSLRYGEVIHCLGAMNDKRNLMILTDAHYSRQEVVNKVLGPYTATGKLKIRVEAHPLDSRFRGQDVSIMTKKMNPTTLIYGARRKITKQQGQAVLHKITYLEPIRVSLVDQTTSSGDYLLLNRGSEMHQIESSNLSYLPSDTVAEIIPGQGLKILHNKKRSYLKAFPVEETEEEKKVMTTTAPQLPPRAVKMDTFLEILQLEGIKAVSTSYNKVSLPELGFEVVIDDKPSSMIRDKNPRLTVDSLNLKTYILKLLHKAC